MSDARFSGRLILLAVTAVVLWSPSLFAQLDSPASPDDPASAMYTLDDIYNRLAAGADGMLRGSGFVEPTTGPMSTGRTLNEIMGVAPLSDDGTGLGVAQCVAGQTFWSLLTASWGPQVCTAPNVGAQNVTPGTAAIQILAGFHDGTGSVAGDGDLVSGNIRATVDLFGVTGDSNVVNTSSGDAVAADLQNGRKAWVDGVEVTGTKGGCAGTLSGTRGCDNLSGTVTDLTTDLVWLKLADCAGVAPWAEPSSGVPSGAHTRASNLWDGSGFFSGGDCGLTDGSVEGDWGIGWIEMGATGAGPYASADATD